MATSPKRSTPRRVTAIDPRTHDLPAPPRPKTRPLRDHCRVCGAPIRRSTRPTITIIGGLPIVDESPLHLDWSRDGRQSHASIALTGELGAGKVFALADTAVTLAARNAEAAIARNTQSLKRLSMQTRQRRDGATAAPPPVRVQAAAFPPCPPKP